eukprot:5651635-Pyramimonas_sp.AAC.1
MFRGVPTRRSCRPAARQNAYSTSQPVLPPKQLVAPNVTAQDAHGRPSKSNESALTPQVVVSTWVIPPFRLRPTFARSSFIAVAIMIRPTRVATNIMISPAYMMFVHAPPASTRIHFPITRAFHLR